MIVDGMNVIGSRPTGWWHDRDAAVRDFAGRLRRLAAASGEVAREAPDAGWASAENADITLVLDGRPQPSLPEGASGGIRVCYARRPGPDAADDRIVELLEAEGPDVVVTSDRELRRRVRAAGATVEAPGTLLRRLDELG